MKKLILAALLMCIAFAGFGQGYTTMTPYDSVFVKKTSTADTSINGATSYLVMYGVGIQNQLVNIMFTNTKVSGTVGGTCYLQGSNDQTNWWTLKNYTTQSISGSDTTTLTNATLKFEYTLNPCLYKYLRLKKVMSGTQKCYTTGTLYWCPTLVKNLN